MDHRQEVAQLIRDLPVLGKHQVPLDESCPICLLPFSDFFDDEITNSDPDSGVTRLDVCGHIFCRKDLVYWILTMHGSCPACRDIFLNIRPRSESDDESSDGGEYVPEDDEEDNAFIGPDTDEMEIDEDLDVFESEVDVGDFAGVDLEDYRSWALEGQDEMEWGLTDGESDSVPSEGDMSWNDSEDNATGAGQIDIVFGEGEADAFPNDLTREIEGDEYK